ncbi:MAG: YggS family pyridoxal phosphate-dependent enzyme [Dehalococcoidia bacterium]
MAESARAALTKMRDHELEARIGQVREKMAEACGRSGRQPSDVTLVAVTKTVPAERVLQAVRCGLSDFGENRIQEAVPKIETVTATAETRPRFHLIGHLQTNKVAAALSSFTMIHSVDSERLLRRIANRAAPDLPPVRLLIQVNVAGEESKFGITPSELPSLLEVARDLSAITVEGLMTVPPRVDQPDQVRPFFAALRRLAAENGLRELSMGMTEDYEVAVEEGATYVRVGRAIFGEREA